MQQENWKCNLQWIKSWTHGCEMVYAIKHGHLLLCQDHKNIFFINQSFFFST